MHSIERYGIVALLFLVVTVVGVLMWDGGKDKKKPSERVSSVSAAAPHETPPTLDADARARRLSLLAESQAGPLQRAQQTEAPVAPASTAGLQAAPPATQPVGASAPLTNEPAAKPLYDTPLESAPPSAEPPLRDPIVGAAPTAGTHTYSVRAGDTLSEIAQRELGSSKRWPELVAANPGLDANKLRVGKKILVPGAGKESRAPTTLADASRAPAKAAKSPAKASTWKVGKGENLWRIAERALGDGKRWHEIATLNPRVNPDRLVLGQVLVLPAGAGASPTPGANRAAPGKKATSASPTLVATNAAPERASRRGGRVK